MVSTRQMATSCGGNAAANSSAAAAAAAESARLSVVTRQTSSNFLLDICPSAPSMPSTQQRGLTQTTGPSTSGSTRHSQSTDTQAVVKASAESSRPSVSAATSSNAATKTALNLLDLPVEMLSSIFSYLDYKKVGQMRVISRRMNEVCMLTLNSTFSKLIKHCFKRLHAIKANMPRRESARRNHPLACECDIIETCYMRLSLLQMTFGKHIERGHCCFFPAAILDEVYTILLHIKNTPKLERPYRVTDELFDLSTMAMEYFRDRIEPTLPDIAYFNKDYYQLSISTMEPTRVSAPNRSDDSPSNSSPPQSNMVLRKGIRKIKQGMKMYNNQLSLMRNELRTCKRKSAEQSKQIAEQQRQFTEQQKQNLEYANRLDENDKKNEEIARKFSTLLQELNKCKTELQYWRSKSPAIPTCTSCGQKVAPVLPPEDYQALINQGVKPEDIILNLNDDTDAESDSASENNLTLESEFVFPDETTTAKLLAVNTATKNLKRQHTTTSDLIHMSTGTTATDCSSECNELSLVCNSVSVILNEKASGSINANVNFGKMGNVIRSTGTTTQLTNAVFPNSESTAGGDGNDLIVAGTSSGYPTKLFYGPSGVQQHKGVIVSPAMLARAEAKSFNDSGGAADYAHENETTAEKSLGGVEDVATLQAITSHETKKARRVQKSTRCMSGTSGKRNK